MDYQNLTSPNYTAGATPDTGAVRVFNNLVHSYLDLVQRNSFPPDFLSQIINQGNVNNAQTKEILVYEVGYLVALAIGVVFIVLMTLVGLFFACCRCCGNCGGKMYQKQTKRMTCKRIFLYWFTFIITLIILAGDICAFYSNSKMYSLVNNSLSDFNNTVNNLKTYVNTVPKDVDIIINSSNVPLTLANNSIIDIGSVLGGMIKKDVENKANPTLNSVQNIIDVLGDTAKLLMAINNSFNTLQDQQKQLSNNLTALRSQINTTLNSCTTCASKPSIDDLTIDANFDGVSIPVNKPLNTINDFLNSGIGDTLQKARQVIIDIPQTVNNQTKSSVQNVQTELGNIKQKIQDFRSNIPVLDSLNTVNSYFDTAMNYTGQYQSDAVKYSYYVWIVGICLSCIILLVVVCNLLGLLFGPCGHKANIDPTNRNCASNCGGEFFMAGAGFSFLFAWLLMLVTGVLFAVGGNAYTSFCKPWSSQQLYQFVDANINLSKQLDLNISNLTITGLYRDCQNNSPLWSALNLNSLVNLDQYLNISAYTGNVNSTLENTDISINNITFMDSNQQSKVDSVSTSGIDSLDFTDLNQQLAKSITKTDLLAFAAQLEGLANNSSEPIKTNLNDEAKSLRDLQTSINNNLLPEIANIKNNINVLQSNASKLPGLLNATVKDVGDTQTFITSNVPGIVKNETRTYLNIILGYFESYIAWTKLMLTSYLARCGPVAGAITSTEVVVCEHIVGTFNIFWFSLGWCTIFFIPSIIVSVKLAKHYRKMKTSDIYEGPNDHLEMTSTSQQFLIPRVTAKA